MPQPDAESVAESLALRDLASQRHVAECHDCVLSDLGGT